MCIWTHSLPVGICRCKGLVVVALLPFRSGFVTQLWMVVSLPCFVLRWYRPGFWRDIWTCPTYNSSRTVVADQILEIHVEARQLKAIDFGCSQHSNCTQTR